MPTSAEFDLQNAHPSSVRCDLLESMDPQMEADKAFKIASVCMDVPDGYQRQGAYNFAMVTHVTINAVTVFVVDRVGDSAETRFIDGVQASTMLAENLSQPLPSISMQQARDLLLHTVANGVHAGSFAAASLFATGSGSDYIAQVSLIKEALECVQSTSSPRTRQALLDSVMANRGNKAYKLIPPEVQAKLETLIDAVAAELREVDV